MTLFRKTAHSVRYYSVSVFPTLFDDFLLLHYCGTDCSKNSKKSYFDNKKDALLHSLTLIGEKQKNGFKPIRPIQKPNFSQPS